MGVIQRRGEGEGLQQSAERRRAGVVRGKLGGWPPSSTCGIVYCCLKASGKRPNGLKALGEGSKHVWGLGQASHGPVSTRKTDLGCSARISEGMGQRDVEKSQGLLQPLR